MPVRDQFLDLRSRVVGEYGDQETVDTLAFVLGRYGKLDTQGPIPVMQNAEFRMQTPIGGRASLLAVSEFCMLNSA
jgi:hypothetical protein